MSQPLYERYKEALRKGHVAALRGRLDAALVAFAEAAELAPDRALPHVSLGDALRRLGRFAEARAAYDAALARDPSDQGALRGRSAAFLETGRRVEAAEDLERAAEALDAAGKTEDALDLARSALEIAEAKSRRRLVERLTAAVRAEEPEDSIAAALAEALLPLEPGEATIPDGDVPASAASIEPHGGLSEPDPASADGVGIQGAPSVDAPALVAEGEALLDGGDLAGAREKLLAGAAAHRAAGRPDAAVDACLTLLAASPSDPHLHLAIAELQRDRGWRAAAAEKVRLLVRLADLDDDPAAGQAIRELVGARLGPVPED